MAACELSGRASLSRESLRQPLLPTTDHTYRDHNWRCRQHRHRGILTKSESDPTNAHHGTNQHAPSPTQSTPARKAATRPAEQSIVHVPPHASTGIHSGQRSSSFRHQRFLCSHITAFEQPPQERHGRESIQLGLAQWEPRRE